MLKYTLRQVLTQMKKKILFIILTIIMSIIAVVGTILSVQAYKEMVGTASISLPLVFTFAGWIVFTFAAFIGAFIFLVNALKYSGKSGDQK